MKTASFNTLKEMLENTEAMEERLDNTIVIRGPKGVGKSFSLVGLFAEYSMLKKKCLIFTQNSMKFRKRTIQYLSKLCFQLQVKMQQHV